MIAHEYDFDQNNHHFIANIKNPKTIVPNPNFWS